MKIAINRCFGGFSVSEKVYDELGLEYDGYGYLENDDFDLDTNNYHAYRAQPELVAAIEKLGSAASGGSFANIVIVEIPDDVEWTIEEYDGNEHVAEKHRTW